MYTYEIAPVFNLMEEAISLILCDQLRWEKTNYDYMFTPGGSLANLYGVLLARHYKFPNLRNIGLSSLGKELALFTSELGHYSIMKNAIVTGIGLDNVYKVKTDLEGRLIPSDLREKIEESIKKGKIPLMCNATIGTTVYGAIDPLKEIATICKEYNIWLHADGCFGGHLVFLSEYNDKLEGLKYFDSFVFDFHKVLEIPLQCSIVLTSHKGLFKECNTMNANYLFMKDKVSYDSSLDKGDASIQCGRHIDVLKLWIYFKSLGLDGLIGKLRNTLKVTKYLCDKLKKNNRFELLIDPEYYNVSFHFFGELDQSNKDEEFWKKVHLLAPKVKAEMVSRGSMMIAYQYQTQVDFKKPGYNFFRVVVLLDKTEKDMDFIVEEMKDIGKKLMTKF